MNYAELDVYQVVAAITERMGWVKKDGSVSFNKTKYDYPSEAAFLAATKPLFEEYGLIVHPCDAEFVPSNRSQVTAIRVTYKFVASKYLGDGPREFTVVTLGEGGDNLDKGVFKAFTGAYKYALRQTLMIGTGDDPEATDENGGSTSSGLYDVFVQKLQDVGHSISDEEVQKLMEREGLTIQMLNAETESAVQLAKSIVKELKE